MLARMSGSDSLDFKGIHAITARITKVTQARALADVGKFDKALAILRRVRGKYTEERMQRRVDWLIEDIERRKRPRPVCDAPAAPACDAPAARKGPACDAPAARKGASDDSRAS
jgi:hypothetical protein